MPEAGGLSRTAQIQPGVFFTFDAPFVRILTLYSNTLEDPGVISNATIGNSQLDFLKAALERVKSENYAGALLIADHHPPYTADSIHGWSVEMLGQIDAVCNEVGVWPHAFLSGHVHNYQRFTRTRRRMELKSHTSSAGMAAIMSRHSRRAAHHLAAPQIIQAAKGSSRPTSAGEL